MCLYIYLCGCVGGFGGVGVGGQNWIAGASQRVQLIPSVLSIYHIITLEGGGKRETLDTYSMQYQD